MNVPLSAYHVFSRFLITLKEHAPVVTVSQFRFFVNNVHSGFVDVLLTILIIVVKKREILFSVFVNILCSPFVTF